MKIRISIRRMALTRRMTIKFSLLILAIAALPLTLSKALDMKNIFKPNLSKLEFTHPHETKPSCRKKLKFFTTALFIAIYTICKTVKTEMPPPLASYREDLKSERARAAMIA